MKTCSLNMQLKVERLSFMQCAEIITWFLDGGSWEQSIRASLVGLSKKPTKTEIANILQKKIQPKEKEYENNIKKFIEWWNTDGVLDCDELQKIMEIKSPSKKRVITWQVGDTFVCPRDIEDWSFVMSPSLWKWSAINIALHEITHFVWFEKVKQIENIKHFNQDQQDENYLPYWLLSEIVIDPILNSTNFAKKYGMTWKSYKEFYEIKIKNKNLMKYIKTLWNNRTSFDDFYKKSSKFVYENWKEINEKYLNCYNK